LNSHLAGLLSNTFKTKNSNAAIPAHGANRSGGCSGLIYDSRVKQVCTKIAARACELLTAAQSLSDLAPIFDRTAF
jgi:hypothetical protein